MAQQVKRSAETEKPTVSQPSDEMHCWHMWTYRKKTFQTHGRQSACHGTRETAKRTTKSEQLDLGDKGHETN